jgi:CDP-paratose 2-epimerase
MSGHVLITGGAGFIGTNLADRLLREGRRVVIFDDLSRRGVDGNLRWLEGKHAGKLRAEIADIRDSVKVLEAVERASAVFHLAAQVAVTTSLDDPLTDFAVNAQGTLHLLEALRRRDDPPPLVFTSTNKVYGALDDVALVEGDTRYEPRDRELACHGISEARPLEFHSPYGCSKGTADQYVLDYARTFDLPAVVFRMSCIYGPHQRGNEDQGWLAHFLLRALDRQPITIYGDGKQVRDALFVEDLVEAFLLALERIDDVRGEAFNMGGGAANTTSLVELIELIRGVHGEVPPVTLEAWRLADQRYYVSDTRKFQTATGWAPTVPVPSGVTRLYKWLLESRAIPVDRWVVGSRGELHAGTKRAPADDARGGPQGPGKDAA